MFRSARRPATASMKGVSMPDPAPCAYSKRTVAGAGPPARYAKDIVLPAENSCGWLHSRGRGCRCLTSVNLIVRDGHFLGSGVPYPRHKVGGILGLVRNAKRTGG